MRARGRLSWTPARDGPARFPAYLGGLSCRAVALPGRSRGAAPISAYLGRLLRFAVTPLDGEKGNASAAPIAAYLGGLLCFAVAPLCERLGIPFSGAPALLCLIGGLICFFLSCRTAGSRAGWRAPIRWVLAIELAGLLVVALFSLEAIGRYPRDLGRPNRFWTDAIAMMDCAAQLTVQGHNPYRDLYQVDCFTHLHLDGRFGTPLLAGRFAGEPDHIPRYLVIQTFEVARRHHVQHPAEFESYPNYPAGAFLLPAPFLAPGWVTLDAFYLGCAVAAYLLLALSAPRRRWPWLVLLALGNLNLWAYAVRGFDEAPVVLLMLVAWMLGRRPIFSAVALGLAVATRQDAWTFALFYLVWAGRNEGRRAVIGRAATVGPVFALVNAPFAISSPADWFNGVFGPLKDPLLPAGIGLVGLRQSSGLPLWPHTTYTVLMLLALAAALWYYGRICRQHPHVALVLAVVPLLFAWRSLFVYFFSSLPILCLWPLLRDDAVNRRGQGVRPQVAAYGPSDGLQPARRQNRNGLKPASWRDMAHSPD